MRIEEMEIKSVSNSVEPALEFNVKIVHDMHETCLLDIIGFVYAEDDYFIGELRESAETENQLQELAALEGGKKVKETLRLPMRLVLNEHALKYLEDTRVRNIKHDVILKIKFRIRFFRTHSGPTFLKVEDSVQELSKRIYSNDWIYDYAPALKLGRHCVVEIPEVEVLGARLSNALDELKQAQKNLISGKEVEALNNVRNALMNHILCEIKKEAYEKGKEKITRYLDEELKNTVLNSVPQSEKDIYKVILENMERLLRHTLHTCISKFIHLDTGKLICTPLRADVDYAYFQTLSTIKYLSELGRQIA